VEQEAEFPGGVEAWTAYVQRKVKLNPAKKGAPPGKYQVIIRFIVLKDGSISGAEPETNYGYGMEKEVLKVIQSGPKWIPAQQNGRVVNAYRRQPVTFIIEKS
jgi:protein TonB